MSPRGMARAGLALAFVLNVILCVPARSQAQTEHATVARRSTPKLVGDAVCLTRHAQYSSYLHTSHHLTSQLAGPDSILGSFTGGGSKVGILEPAPDKLLPGLRFQMERKGDGYYETAVAGLPGHGQSHTARIDIVTGSGTRGQSYLYWLGDQLFELPVSYRADGQKWINSPGFKDHTANFSRAIYPRCLECHATNIIALSPEPLENHYDKASLITDISCETCHGQGAEHVAAEAVGRRGAARSLSSIPHKTILNPATFTRDRQVDLCALCHSGGQRRELRPAFSYVPGESLDDYLESNPQDAATQPEVHGNQVGLLKRSRCYLWSPGLNCSTCHDVHSAEKPAATDSSRCLSCHKVESCNMSKTMGPSIARNCIDCHKPEQSTRAIVSTTGGDVVRATMRTHWIRIYPDATKP